MTNTIDEVVAYAHAHPLRDGGPWHNWCESFVYRAGGFTKSFPTAWAAGSASGPLNPNHAAAPKGAIHYWNQRTASEGPGHVGFSMGDDVILMASNAVVYKWGTDIGTCTFEQYRKAKPAMIYQGWTMRHGNETLRQPPVVVAAAETTKISPAAAKPATQKETEVADRGEILDYREVLADGRTQSDVLFYRSPTRGIVGIRNEDELKLLQRWIEHGKPGAKKEVMFPVQREAINWYYTGS
ncbi:MAG: uncharacterized protein JWO15_3649 [Sphingomonadales bacterium]|nr:uncharacterized protein [Sphingomonadales bacterium]